MPLTALVTLLAMIMYLVVVVKVGGARKRTGIQVPATSGNDEFERYYRVQMNTLEQMVFFLPVLWISAYYVSDRTAAGFGALWVVGRILYALGYYKEAKKRANGFYISAFASIALLLGALWGVGTSLVR